MTNDKDFSDFEDEFSLDDLLELSEDEMSKMISGEDEDEDEDLWDEPEEDSKEDAAASLLAKIDSGEYVQEALRDLVFQSVKDSFEDSELMSGDGNEGSQKKGSELVKEKKKELYDILDNIDNELAGKDVQEVTAFFSSLLDIQSQLCLQKTDGVISVRSRLCNFFTPSSQGSRPEFNQEVSLIFTPEEINAMRARIGDMDDDDMLKPFITMVLDQAYDVVQYNEMTGNLLLEMTRYFLSKLEKNGYGNTTKTAEFFERHKRSKISLDNALEELREVERVINRHLYERPVLLTLPNLLRALIQVKLGLLEKKEAPETLKQIYATLGEYARARSAVAFDFNRLPSYQHGVRLRHSIILNLHKDVLEYTGNLFEKEFQSVKAELDEILKEIETTSETAQPGTPEYNELMKKKAQVQQKLETHRQKLDVVRGQERLVDVQHQMIGQAIKRYQKNEAQYQKLEDDLKSRSQVDPDKVRKVPKVSKEKKPSRMVMKKKISR